MKKKSLSKKLINALALVIISFLVIGCQTHQYAKNSLDVERLTTHHHLDKIFSSPAYPVGNPKDRVNVSFYAKVLGSGEVSYTMWLAFPKKLHLRSIQSGGIIVDWKFSPADHQITLIAAQNISVADTFILTFDDEIRQISIPEWWIQGFSSKFEKMVAKEKLIADLKKEKEIRQVKAKKVEEQWEEVRRKYINKRRQTNERIAKLIEQKSIGIGMTKDDVIYSWGEPDKINRSVYSWGVHEQWIYSYRRDTNVYFENDILTSWQEVG